MRYIPGSLRDGQFTGMTLAPEMIAQIVQGLEDMKGKVADACYKKAKGIVDKILAGQTPTQAELDWMNSDWPNSEACKPGAAGPDAPKSTTIIKDLPSWLVPASGGAVVGFVIGKLARKK